MSYGQQTQSYQTPSYPMQTHQTQPYQQQYYQTEVHKGQEQGQPYQNQPYQSETQQIRSSDPPSSPLNEKSTKYPSPENPSKRHILPTSYEDGRLVTKGINPEGESGRAGFHPLHFFRVAWRSATPWNKWLNLLWPFVPAAIVLRYVYKEHPLVVFTINYLAIIPPASLLGFAGQELARKLPRVMGILLETALGSVVEIILFVTLIIESGPEKDLIPVIKAAILGSILANLLLCLGACFFVGGLKWRKEVEQKFHPVISEVGSGLLLVAGFGLLVPTAFYSALRGNIVEGSGFGLEQLRHNTHKISQGTSVILMVAFITFIFYSSWSHDSIFDEVLRQDEENDADRERDMARQKFTLTETVIALVISIACVALCAVFLVETIEPIVTDYGVPDNFMGLILVPLVEKVAEHITAVDEAYDNQIVSWNRVFDREDFADQDYRTSLYITALGRLFRLLSSMLLWSFSLVGVLTRKLWI